MKQFVIAAAAAAAIAAGAQPVYRCGSSYGQQPCAGGTALAIDDARTPAESTRAANVSRDDARRADAMEKARLAQERNAPRAIVIGPAEAPRPSAKPEKDASRPKAGKPDQFTAVSPRKPGDAKKPKKKKKAGG